MDDKVRARHRPALGPLEKLLDELVVGGQFRETSRSGADLRADSAYTPGAHHVMREVGDTLQHRIEGSDGPGPRLQVEQRLRCGAADTPSSVSARATDTRAGYVSSTSAST